MSIEALKSQHPVQLFYIQAAIYDGAVRYLIRENRAKLCGDHYECVAALRDGLREAVQQLKAKVAEIERIAIVEKAVLKRYDFAWSVSGKV